MSDRPSETLKKSSKVLAPIVASISLLTTPCQVELALEPNLPSKDCSQWNTPLRDHDDTQLGHAQDDALGTWGTGLGPHENGVSNFSVREVSRLVNVVVPRIDQQMELEPRKGAVATITFAKKEGGRDTGNER